MKLAVFDKLPDFPRVDPRVLNEQIADAVREAVLFKEPMVVEQWRHNGSVGVQFPSIHDTAQAKYGREFVRPLCRVDATGLVTYARQAVAA